MMDAVSLDNISNEKSDDIEKDAGAEDPIEGNCC